MRAWTSRSCNAVLNSHSTIFSPVCRSLGCSQVQYSNHERIQTFYTHPRRCPRVNLQKRRRKFHTTGRLEAISFRDLKSDEKGTSEPEPSIKSDTNTDIPEIDPEDPAEQAYRRATQKTRKDWEAEKARLAREAEEKDKKTDEASEKPQKEAPPPPHGNKSPWQVFTDTLSTEFKASKEWNDSTKQLASSAHHFSESESIRRARAAYSAASGAATSSTASALKGTGKVLGQGAAWTWDTSVVKGIRSGANAAGRGIDKATQPLRETEAFKSVKDVVDDGSSTRYGGWLEKEERRRRRELRAQEPRVSNSPSVEDPE